MARSFKRYLSFSFSFFVSVALGYGQRSDEEVPTYSGEIQFFVRGSGNFRDLVIFEDARSPVSVSLFNGRRSVAYDYTGRLEYGLFRQTGVRDGLPQYTLAGKVTLSPDTSKTLILVIENPAFGIESGATEFLLFACSDDLTTLPWDHIAFWNLTGAVLDAVLGDELHKVTDGMNDALSIEPHLEEKSTLIGLSLRYEGRDRVLLQTRKRFYPGRRVLFVLLPPSDPDSLAIEVFRITEINRAAVE